MTRHVGVDGCRLGWIAVFRDRGALRYALHETFDGLLRTYPRAERVLVDIPIGLPWAGYPKRHCDSEARRLLRYRSRSVFSPPCREASKAETYPRANAANRRALGSGLSKQTYAICQKIAEVDQVLRSKSAARRRVREMHPELCFAALNKGVPMRSGKKTAGGRAERLRLLRKHAPGSPALLRRVLRERRRKDVQPDDVLDALVGLVVAAAPTIWHRRISANPARDRAGLRMEMVYAVPAPR